VQPIGKTILGGLSVSTFLTLFLVPVLYSIFNQMAERRLARGAARKQRIRQRRLQEART
jgi:HAE1 family hydrophobic/amphiphilic exporter-1